MPGKFSNVAINLYWKDVTNELPPEARQGVVPKLQARAAFSFDVDGEGYEIDSIKLRADGYDDLFFVDFDDGTHYKTYHVGARDLNLSKLRAPATPPYGDVPLVLEVTCRRHPAPGESGPTPPDQLHQLFDPVTEPYDETLAPINPLQEYPQDTSDATVTMP